MDFVLGLVSTVEPELIDGRWGEVDKGNPSLACREWELLGPGTSVFTPTDWGSCPGLLGQWPGYRRSRGVEAGNPRFLPVRAAGGSTCR